MFSPKRIRSQMYFGVATLMVIMVVLFFGSLHGLLKFRDLTRRISEQSEESPMVASLGQQVSELRSELWQLNQSGQHLESNPYRQAFIRLSVQSRLHHVEQLLDQFETAVDDDQTGDFGTSETEEEKDLIEQFRHGLKQIRTLTEEPGGPPETFQKKQLFDPLESELANLQTLTTKLPILMQTRMERFSRKAKRQYGTLVTVSSIFGIVALVTIVYLIWGFRNRIARPLEILIAGSREVAHGNYSYRIVLNTNDEVAELASALNAMTENFQRIESDLNQQVQIRTKEVVRSEKMASVGFLAAGVAHEINNPLATIAWSAESLEMRLIDALTDSGILSDQDHPQEIAEMLKNLRRIQDEAFRCKGITAGLLDFSRMGDVQKVPHELNEIIAAVIEMVRPLSKYRDRNIHFYADLPVECICNGQEMKQVVLNLITNALGSVEHGGVVDVSLTRSQDGQSAVLQVQDDGCGMTEEVKTHLFEPFFTRRRDGQGTGLGLSITYQIIADHGGQIAAHSDGPGCGSTFCVTLPLVKNELQSIESVAA